ncbi:MAG: hypothetical protein WC564_00790 [Patescibacteria group bacterium]
MTLSKKSHKPTTIHKASHSASIKRVSGRSDAAKRLLSMVEKPQLEKISSIKVTSPEPITPPSPSAPLSDNFDSRKQFFQMMSQQINQDAPKAPTPKTDELDKLIIDEQVAVPGHSIGTYRKLAFRFIALALVLVLAVLYFVLVKMTVIVTPGKQVVNDSLIVDVYGANQIPDNDRSLRGNITRIEAEESGVFQSSGESSVGGGFSGRVKVINNYSQNQPLVATTRLLSPDNKLFRIKNNITVPAGGSVEVDVYPDKSGNDMAISPTKFTIPGLWSGLQDKIYAESLGAFTFGSTIKKSISQSDVDRATQELNNLLTEKVKAKVGAKNGYDQVIYQVSTDTAQIELVNAKVGDQKDQFSASVKNIVNVISFSSSDIIKIAQQKMSATNPDSKAVAEIDRANLEYELEGYDSQNNIATLKFDFASRLASVDSEFIDKGKLVNLNQSQIENYLKGVKEIDSFELHFFPGFLKRSPALVDRIYIEVK